MSPFERGIVPLTPEEKARMLQKAERQMKFSLEGEWNAALAIVRYADVVRYQPGITPETCANLFNMCHDLVNKAKSEDDRDHVNYFGSMRDLWINLHNLLVRQPTQVE